ncbi:uncharacterized protein LOC133825124 [Humulus lupulus]|uniref:uncharacterized protein LOC133825124 n=1 Tax=Humulus lupulus TaxID=3486 RepID=UPI002B41343A|nr:uncharacterized protein LOC133825124 [Humulus lupulus]
MYSLDIRVYTSLLIHCIAQASNQAGRFYITFVYGFNDELNRERLWKDIKGLASHIDEAWMILGDFNEILNQNERISKKVNKKPSPSFWDCMIYCQMEDLKFSGCFYIWNNKQQPDDRVYSKIDRALLEENLGKKPLRYFRMWKEASTYVEKVKTSWTEPIKVTEMYKLVKRLKQVFLDINREGFNDIQKAEFQEKQSLMEIQEDLHKDPLNVTFMEQEQLVRDRYTRLHKAYILFLAQKAKANWILNGDENTSIFHASLKARRTHNRIHSIKNEEGFWVDTADGVKAAFLGYYQRLLGTAINNIMKIFQSIVELGPVISDAHSRLLQAEFTTQEVKEAIFSIPGMKAPGPDGFSSFFYQDYWDLVGSEVSFVVLSFLNTGQLLKILMQRLSLSFQRQNFMIMGLKLFSSTSGLLPNETKSAVYCSGMVDSEVRRVLEVSDFTRSHLPFRSVL